MHPCVQPDYRVFTYYLFPPLRLLPIVLMTERTIIAKALDYDSYWKQ